MLSLALGPLVISVSHLLLLLALVLATLLGWLAGRRQGVNPERVLFRLFVLSLVAARIAFVALYWRQYVNSPLSIIDIRDGGFVTGVGLATLVIGAVLYGCKRPLLRKSIGVSVASGLLFWGLGTLALESQQQAARLPDVALHNKAGERVQLSDYAGKKLVINLWATWCPPCRREMPVLQAAQQAHPDTVFLFVNQGESPEEVASFLASQGLQLNNVSFDRSGELAQRVGSAALPTTLFYRPDGRLAGSHLGELSSASLSRSLGRLDETAMSAVTH